MRKASVFVASIVPWLVLGAVCVIAFRVNSNLKTIARDVRAEGAVPFETVQLAESGAGTRTVGGPAFSALAPADAYTTGVAIRGTFYLAGPAGVTMYSESSGAAKRLRAGFDLPTAPIVAIAAAHLRGGLGDSLVAATRGEGLLIFAAELAGGVQLRPKDPAARDITAVLPLNSGDLLLGTRQAGLMRYDGKELTRFLPQIRDAVTALAGSEGDLWIGTQDGGVLHWRAGELTRFDENSGLPDAQVNDILASEESVFVGTPVGVAEFSDGRLLRVLGKGLFVQGLALDGSTLLVATMDQGVQELVLGTERVAWIARFNDGLHVLRFVRAGDDLLAVAEEGGVLRREPGGGWENVISSAGQAIADQNVSALAFGPDGRLWIGYFDRGVDVMDMGTRRVEHFEDDQVFCVNRIVPDPQRLTMDVATANGLVLFDPGKTRPPIRQVLSRRDGLISDQITDVTFGGSGTVVATPAGVTFLTASGAQSIYAFQGLVNNHVYAVAAEPDGRRVMAGTLGGISVLEDQSVVRNVSLRNSGLRRNWITALAKVPEPDAPETWFVGTYGGGVMEMDSAGHVSAMSTGAPEAVVNPNAMLRTDEHVFVGTLSDGMLAYNRSTHHWSHTVTGLPSRNVTAFAVRDGELYVGTDNGVVHVAEKELP